MGLRCAGSRRRQVVPQQWLTRTTAPGVAPDDRRRLDLVIYIASASSDRVGAAIDVARRRKQQRYPEFARPGPQRLVVLAAGVGGRWGQEAHDLVRCLARQRSLRAPWALRVAARAGWARRWWGQLSCALQRALASTVYLEASGECWRSLLATSPPISLLRIKVYFCRTANLTVPDQVSAVGSATDHLATRQPRCCRPRTTGVA